jgi:hypothetical protein
VKFRSTLVYFLIVLTLTAFYFFDGYQRSRKKGTEEKATRVFEFKSDVLRNIILAKGNEQIKIEKGGVSAPNEFWQIVTPIHADVDPVVLNMFIIRLTELKSRRTINENLNDLASFRLDKPSFTVTCQTEKTTESLFFGSQNPAGNAFYARKGNANKVILIDIYDKEDLDQELFNLRDKRIFTLPASKVTRLTLTRGPTTWNMIKKQEQWSLKEDPSLKIDQGKVEGLMRRSTWQQALSFEDEKALNLKPYGLDKPQSILTLSDDILSEQLLIGNPFPNEALNKTYAKIKGKPQVITINTSFVSSLPNSIAEFHENPSIGPTRRPGPNLEDTTHTKAKP